MDVNPNNTYLLRNSDTHIIRRGRVHSSQLKHCIERTKHNNSQQMQQQPQHQSETPTATTQDTQTAPRNTTETTSQGEDSETLTIEKVHRATRPQQGKRWYYVKIKGQRETRVVPEDSIPQHMKEAFHIQKHYLVELESALFNETSQNSPFPLLSSCVST